MKKGCTEVVFILDRSGSMAGLESDTIGGFNAMIKKQRKEEGETKVSCILFDDVSEVIYDRVPIDEIKEMTEEEYYVRGCTALLDAVGSSIHHMKSLQKKMKESDRPEKTIFIITTDGMENSSKEYSHEKVKKLIKKAEEKYHFEFIFLGANIDAISVAGSFGLRKERAFNYHSDKRGTAVNFEALSDTVSGLRKSKSREEADLMVQECMAPVMRDYEERKGK